MSRTLRLPAALVMIALAGAAARAQTPAEQVASRARGYVVPRTPWGDPDLNGIWPSIDMVRVPVQRLPQFGTRLFMTAEEHAATFNPLRLDGPEDFTMWERCFSRGALGSTLPVLYNSGIDITQGPGYVGIRYEMVHDHRMIRIDRTPHVPPSIRLHMGDARGRWEGDTLVVETTNFTDKIGVGLSGGGTPNSHAMRLVERFTRVAPDTIRYEATVEDPRTWTAPWTVAFPLTRMPDYGMFEYACHEGDYGLRNALSAARAGERGASGVSPAQDAQVPAVWTVTRGMDSPESAYFDPASGWVFVSQIGGQAAARDGNGRISKLALDGTVVAADWVSGLNAPKGLRSHQGILYAADLDEVVGIEIASGKIVSRLKIEGAQFLNDLATAPDGTIYTSDSFANRIYAITDGKASTFFEGDAILLPNGVLVDGNRLIVASDGRPGRGGAVGTPARLVAIDLAQGSGPAPPGSPALRKTTVLNTAPIGTPDGIEKDGKGGFLVSDVGGGRILQVAPGGEVRVLRQLAAQTADIGYVPARGLLIVPHLGLNRVSAYDLSEVLK